MVRRAGLLLLSLVAGGCGGALLPATPGMDPEAQVVGGRIALGDVRFVEGVCRGIDVTSEYRPLDEQSVIAFLKGRGFEVQAARARGDLIYIEVRAAPSASPVRLRVAVLETPAQAAAELHQAVLQHGSGWWGVHRANVAILGPEGKTRDIIAFTAKTKLACWGVVTVAGADDAYVIPGGYRQI